MSPKSFLIAIATGIPLLLALLFYEHLDSPALVATGYSRKGPVTQGTFENAEFMDEEINPMATILRNEEVPPNVMQESLSEDDDQVLQGKKEPEVILITNGTVIQPSADWMSEGDEAFNNCPNLQDWMKCSFNSSRAAQNSSNAIVFHARHLIDESYIPRYRPEGQKWVFYETEPPPKTWDRVKYDMNVWKEFNFTVSYMDNADLMHALYKMVCKLSKDWKSSGRNHVANKTKMAAWIVSNCVSDSRREVYVKELSKYISVDKFGACGEDTHCGPYPEGASCINKLLTQYKFYLAFENGFCTEYYTEKVGKTIPINVVPVVLGQMDYHHLLPSDAYIDVRNFSSVADLAAYLQYVDSNDTIYNNYIESKSRVECEQLDTLSFPCKLCEHLHRTQDVTEKVEDAREYWSVQRLCQSPKEVYSEIAPELLSDISMPKGFKAVGME